jgi:hypothetical protein
MALMFGTAGLPHILMRFFTVPDAKQARKSVFWATTWIGYFYVLIFIIGFGAITMVLTNPEFANTATGVIKGGGGSANMAAVLVAKAIGGNIFFGFISAVAFATILAVVAGLTLSGASAVSHDLYATVIKDGKADGASELRVSRMTTVALGILAVVLGIVFEKQNIAFMVSLAFAIAASANFPVLFMSVLWKDCTTRGAVIGGFLGLASSVLLTIVSPSVWEATLGNPKGSALFPYASPALFSMTIGFVGIWLFSILDRSPRAAQDRAGFLAQQVRSETGIGQMAVSVSYAAVELARKIFGDLTGKTVMIIGASKMGELAARHLKRNGVTSVLVTNRTFEKAVEVAKVFDGAAIPFEHFEDHIDRAEALQGQYQHHEEHSRCHHAHPVAEGPSGISAKVSSIGTTSASLMAPATATGALAAADPNAVSSPKVFTSEMRAITDFSNGATSSTNPWSPTAYSGTL